MVRARSKQGKGRSNNFVNNLKLPPLGKEALSTPVGFCPPSRYQKRSWTWKNLVFSKFFWSFPSPPKLIWSFQILLLLEPWLELLLILNIVLLIVVLFVFVANTRAPAKYAWFMVSISWHDHRQPHTCVMCMSTVGYYFGAIRQNVSYLAWRDIISLVSWSAMVVVVLVVVVMLDPDWSGGIWAEAEVQQQATNRR